MPKGHYKCKLDPRKHLSEPVKPREIHEMLREEKGSPYPNLQAK